MELSAAVAILMAVVAPFIVAVVTRPDWSSEKKRNAALIVSGVMGAIVAVATGKIAQIPDNVESWFAQGVVVIGIVVSLAQGFYQVLKDPVTKVEALTSPKPLHAIPDDAPPEALS